MDRCPECGEPQIALGLASEHTDREPGRVLIARCGSGHRFWLDAWEAARLPNGYWDVTHFVLGDRLPDEQ